MNHTISSFAMTFQAIDTSSDFMIEEKKKYSTPSWRTLPLARDKLAVNLNNLHQTEGENF